MDATASNLIGCKRMKEGELVLLVLIRIKRVFPLVCRPLGTLNNKVLAKLYLTTF